MGKQVVFPFSNLFAKYNAPDAADIILLQTISTVAWANTSPRWVAGWLFARLPSVAVRVRAKHFAIQTAHLLYTPHNSCASHPNITHPFKPTLNPVTPHTNTHTHTHGYSHVAYGDDPIDIEIRTAPTIAALMCKRHRFYPARRSRFLSLESIFRAINFPKVFA